jgi:hypothetical protein
MMNSLSIDPNRVKRAFDSIFNHNAVIGNWQANLPVASPAKGKSKMQLNDYQEEVVRNFVVSNTDSEERTQKLFAAKMGLRTALSELTNAMSVYAEDGNAVRHEGRFFNALCDVMHFSALASEGLGTNLEAIAQYGLDRARRGKTIEPLTH